MTFDIWRLILQLPPAPRSLVDLLLTCLPLFAGFALSILIPLVFSLDIHQYASFFLVTSVFSMLILLPILTIPFLGVVGAFYAYLPVLNRYTTLFWFFEVNLWSSKKIVLTILDSLLLTWLVVAHIAGSLVCSRVFGLDMKRGVSYYMLFIGLTGTISLFLAWGASLCVK